MQRSVNYYAFLNTVSGVSVFINLGVHFWAADLLGAAGKLLIWLDICRWVCGYESMDLDIYLYPILL